MSSESPGFSDADDGMGCDDGGDVEFVDVMHDFIASRLGTMAKSPENFGETRGHLLPQVVLLAEMALLGLGLESDENVYQLVVEMTEGYEGMEQKLAVDRAWAEVMIDKVGKFIADIFEAEQAAHDATCPNCSDPSKKNN